MMWSRRLVVSVLGGLILAAPLAAVAQGLVTFPHATAQIITPAGKHHDLDIEFAQTPEQLTQGLMYRRTMAANAGMLFDFGEVKPVSMWMHNTLIPLDMLFLDSAGQVVGIHERAIPGSSEIISSPQPVRGVLELNGGTVQRLGLAVGDRIDHPMFAAGR